ncbi:MAG: cyclase family protein [Candidatus Dormibacteria bacterium]
MGFHDVTVPLSKHMPIWPGNPGFGRILAQAQSRGDAANVSRIHVGVHDGSHVDAPAHFIEGGRTIEDVSLETLIGPAVVVDASRATGELTPGDLGDVRADRLLFKTRNSDLWATGDTTFHTDFVSVGVALAEILVGRGVRLVGVDYLSIEAFRAPDAHPVHRTLLQAGVVIVEGLDLSEVDAGNYQLHCLPLCILGAEAAPARVVLEGPH